MITFILPGFSAKNKSWAEETAKNITLGGQIRPVFWDHWDDPQKTLNPKEKARILSDIAREEKEINIIAKSVGTLVAAYMMEKVRERVGKIILCGVPSVSNLRLKIYSKAFSDIDSKKITVIQNSGDPFAGFEEVKGFIKKINPKINVLKRERSDHSYPYFEDFNSLLLAG